jgi:hypothetical protein
MKCPLAKLTTLGLARRLDRKPSALPSSLEFSTDEDLAAAPDGFAEDIDHEHSSDAARYFDAVDDAKGDDTDDPAVARVEKGESFARVGLRLFAKTSTGATDRDRISTTAPLCMLCYERRANRIILGCGHSFCFACLEKSLAAAELAALAPARCFRCRHIPRMITRVYD